MMTRWSAPFREYRGGSFARALVVHSEPRVSGMDICQDLGKDRVPLPALSKTNRTDGMFEEESLLTQVGGL